MGRQRLAGRSCLRSPAPGRRVRGMSIVSSVPWTVMVYLSVANVAGSIVRVLATGSPCKIVASVICSDPFSLWITIVLFATGLPFEKISYAYVPDGKTAPVSSRRWRQVRPRQREESSSRYLAAGKVSPAANDESMIAAMLLSLALLVAQVTPRAAPAPMAPARRPLIAGQCLDSPRPVPNVLQPPISAASQIVRIDKVESLHTMMPGEVIGFLYTLGDGSTWLGQRSSDYHVPGRARPKSTKYSVPPTCPARTFPSFRRGVSTAWPPNISSSSGCSSTRRQ